MTLKAYESAQRIAEEPRQTEYRLFGQVTSALINAQKTKATGGPLIEALDWNRTMWHTLATDCMEDGNKLPDQLRANIISISLWVTRYSKDVARKGASLDPLISVNRSIMEGLRGQV